MGLSLPQRRAYLLKEAVVEKVLEGEQNVGDELKIDAVNQQVEQGRKAMGIDCRVLSK